MTATSFAKHYRRLSRALYSCSSLIAYEHPHSTRPRRGR